MNEFYSTHICTIMINIEIVEICINMQYVTQLTFIENVCIDFVFTR